MSLTAGCSSEQNSDKQEKKDADVFQGYKETYDRARNVEQTLLQADRARREELQRQQ
jgi:hypothetical protein